MTAKAAIEPNTHVVLDYVLYDSDDDLLDASDADDGEPIVYVHGYGMLVPGLEKALVGLTEGDRKDIVVSPEEGFGERDEQLVFEIGRGELPRPELVEVGDEFIAAARTGEEAVMRVVDVTTDAVVLDGNHPLAGETLRYSVVVREVRPATEEEILVAATAFEESSEGYEPEVENGAGAPLVTIGLSSKTSQDTKKKLN